jgi:putative addiction module component (TIGR02574 family)
VVFALLGGGGEIQIMVKLDMDAIRKLSVSERLALVEEIWDSISADPASVPVSQAQIAEARRRLLDHETDPSTAVSWEDGEERLRSKI